MSINDGLTQTELAAYLRRLAGLELEVHASITDEFRKFRRRAFLTGRASALLALAELVERGEIRGGLFAEPIHRLHRDASMPDD